MAVKHKAVSKLFDLYPKHIAIISRFKKKGHRNSGAEVVRRALENYKPKV